MQIILITDYSKERACTFAWIVFFFHFENNNEKKWKNKIERTLSCTRPTPDLWPFDLHPFIHPSISLSNQWLLKIQCLATARYAMLDTLSPSIPFQFLSPPWIE